MLKQLALIGASLVVLGAGGLTAMAASGRAVANPFTDSGLNVQFASGGIVFDRSGSADSTSSGIPLNVNLGPSVTWNKQSTLSATGIQNLRVDVDAAAVTIHPDTSGNIEVHGTGTLVSIPLSDISYSASTSGDTADIQLHTVTGGINIGTSHNLSLDIGVPKHLYDSLIVTAGAGKLNLSDLSAKHIQLQAAAGTVSVANVTADVNLTTQTGTVHAQNVTGSLTAHATTGAITVTNVSQTLNITTTTGSINVHQTTIARDMNIRCITGHVTISETQPSPIRFHLHTVTGRVSVGLRGATFTTHDSRTADGQAGQATSASPQVDVSVTTGSATLN